MWTLLFAVGYINFTTAGKAAVERKLNFSTNSAELLLGETQVIQINLSPPLQEGDTAVTFGPPASSTGCGMLTACQALPFQR